MRITVFLSSCFVIVILLMTGWAHAANFVVDSLGDLDDGISYTPGDGTNTLRKCIRLANNNFGGDNISFAVSGIISPGSSLPEVVDDGTIIDASSYWNGVWPSGQPGITLDGFGAGLGEEGLKIFGASNCQIRGLFITNFGGKGVLIFGGAQLNTVGGTGMGARNVISGNGESGVEIRDFSTGNVVSGNYIGTDVTGTVGLGNSSAGVYIWESSDNTVGGSTPGERNIISCNHQDGVAIKPMSPTVVRNKIRLNSIHSNGGLGIDLSPVGVTLNDVGDSDTGANNLQNFPVITTVSFDGTDTTIGGTINSAAGTTFTIDLYSNSAGDPSGYGEGETYLGTTNCTTNGAGNGTWTLTVSGDVTGLALASTATDPSGNTSEFSAPLTNTPPVADAGPDQTVEATSPAGTSVTLDGSGSSDPDGDELTYEWTWSIGEDTYNATGINPTIELPVGEHIIQLIVNDGTIDSEPDYVEIIILNTALSGWVWMESGGDFGYSLNEDDLLYFYVSEPVLTYNFTTGQWGYEGPVGWTCFNWPFFYVLDMDTLWFAYPPESGLWVYHFSNGQWELLPRIIP